MEVTKAQYQQALDVLSKVELAQKAVAAYEEQNRWTEDPIGKIMEDGQVEFIAGEVIRENPMLWRATHLRYVHDKGTVERIISYAKGGMSKDLLSTTSDKITML